MRLASVLPEPMAPVRPTMRGEAVSGLCCFLPGFPLASGAELLID